MLPDPSVVPSELLLGLFPPGAVAMETRERGDLARLSIAEAEHVRHARPKRAQEFAAGRLCARRVLEQFDHSGWDLLVNEDRTPRWPQGIVGSISHTAGYCGAVAGEQPLFEAIGFDVEIASRVSSDLYGQFCTGEELTQLSVLPRHLADLRATLLFSAKEAFYKCQYPVTGEWLDFADIAVAFTKETSRKGGFTMRPCRPLGLEARFPAPWHGRFVFSGELIVTGIALLGSDSAHKLP